MLASKIRKGSKVEIDGVVVRVTKREKWSTTYVKIHFEDCGNGLPNYKRSTFLGANLSGIQLHYYTEKFFKLTDQLEVL